METAATLPSLHALRLASETRLRAELEQQYGRRIEQFMKVASQIEAFEDAERTPGERQFFLAEGVRLSPGVAPHLYALARQALTHLRIENDRVEFYIYRTDVPDAFCSYDQERRIFSVCVAPEYVNILEDLELLDLLGHEIGHAVLDHVQNKFLQAEDLLYDLEDWEYYMNGRRLEKHEQRELAQAREALELLDPPYVARCRRLARLQELSADRIGLLCSRDIGASLVSHMKELTGGLSSKFIKYDAAALLHQNEELDALDRDAMDLFDGTHPITAVRMKSLMIFSQSESYVRFVRSIEDAAVPHGSASDAPHWIHSASETDQMVDDLLRQTERFPSRPSDRTLIKALSAGAVWVLSPPRGGRSLFEALESGLYRLLEYSEVPSDWVHVDRGRARDVALEACAEVAATMTDREREEALRMTLELAQEAGRPAPRYRARAVEIGEALAVPADKVGAVVHEMNRFSLPRRRHGRGGGGAG